MFTQSADFSRIELAFSKFEFLEGLTTEDTESTEVLKLIVIEEEETK